MKKFVTPSGWLIEDPPTMTNRGKGGFIVSKGNIRSYIEKRSNGWCCFKEFEQYSHDCKKGIQLSMRTTGEPPYQSTNLDHALLHTGMSYEEKQEVMSCYLKDFEK